MLQWNAARSSVGSLLAREVQPEVFWCGVRVLGGEVPGEHGRWRFRRSAVDRYRPDEKIRMRHGDVPLTLWIDFGAPQPGRRAQHGLITATVVDTGARIELSVPYSDLYDFGVDL